MKNLYYSTLFCFFIISTTTNLVFASRLSDDLTICGRKTTPNNREILNLGDYGRIFAGNLTKTTCKLELLAWPYTTDIGFRAEYKFTLRAHWPDNPICKTCDKIYDQKGGVIILDPSLINTPNIYIDCIWLVSKSRFSSPLYDQIYLKIRDLSILKHSHKNLSFEIREGLTSRSPLLFNYGTSSLINNYDDSDYICNDAREYHCANGRCIAGNLQCDENDHCGDYSDELPNLCFNMKEITSSDILLQNQYIKKYLVETESSPSINAGGAYATTIILISCIIGLIIVLLIVTVVAGKIYRQRLAALQHQLRAPIVEENSREVGSVAGPSIHQMGERRLFVWPAVTANAATRVFEAPPTYDDALKHPTVPPDGVVNEAFVAMEESEESTPIEGAATTLPSTQIASESGPDSGTLNNSGTLV
uniref:CUB domain-containing protein n=1 Tax=Romanomermis culicivorax TaxID=13658 RepID=A0A915IVQ1_ROMCU